jgi:hypothetical protein
MSPGSNIDHVTACGNGVFVFIFSLSSCVPGHYFEIRGMEQWSRIAKNRNEWIRYKQNSFNRSNVNATTLGIAYLAIKRSIFPGFYQETVALMGLCRLIYFYTYLLICLFI